MNARAAAAAALGRVLGDGRSLDAATPLFDVLPEPRDRAFARELASGTLRFHPRLRSIAGTLLERPLRRRDLDVEIHILIALYQLLYLRVPPHAAVSEAVAGAGREKPWARGLVNGVLRRFLRERESILALADEDEYAALAHPGWLVDALRDAWPGQWRAIIEAGNQRPPMGLRVNARRLGRADYRRMLDGAGIAAEEIPRTTHGLVLADPVDVGDLPGFHTGEVSVQDGAAQLAAPLLAPGAGHRVLDACAAPGGKTAHLAELGSEACPPVAVDIDPERLDRVGKALVRLDLAATLVNADACEPQQWWDGRPFDRILVDAPCSATGVIRRHPDIKVLRRAADLGRLAETQERLLDAVWPLLARSGLLLYATCSLLPTENCAQIASFLTRHREARALPLPASWGHAVEVGRQILPGEDGMDGFYYALLTKN